MPFQPSKHDFIDPRNKFICMVHNDPLGKAFNVKAFHRCQLTRLLQSNCAAKALFSCPAIISQRLEPRITSNEPLENTEEESKII